jgi:hypothetical protein
MRDQTRSSTPSRGVSDVIGYVLIFALVTATIGVLYVTVYDSIESRGDLEEMRNVERAFDILAYNIDDVSSGQAPRRSTEFRLRNAQVYFDTNIEWTIDIVNRNSGAVETFRLNVSPLSYETESGAKATYANGAVIRTAETGESVMFSNPEWRVWNDNAFIPYVLTTPQGGATGISGETIILRTSSIVDQSTVRTTDRYDIIIQATTPRADAWGTYCDSVADAASVTGDQVRCEFTDLDGVFIQRHTIGVELVQ